MMLTWIGYAILCSAALCALAGCIEYAVARLRYPRRILWIVVMLASAGIPVAASLLAKPPVAPTREVVVAATAETRPERATRSGERVNTDRIVQAVWATASLCAAVWFGILQLLLTRRLRRCEHADIAGSSALVSPDFGPAVVGVFHPEIVLPEWALSLDDTDRRLVLAHETEHTRAHDPALHFAGVAVAVLFPWNAGLWWQLKRLRLAIEIDCDARVVAHHGSDPIRYGQLLVTAHGHAGRPIVAALALVQRRSALGRRIDALVALPRRSAGRVAAAAAVGIGSLSAVAFAPAPSLRDPITVSPVAGTLMRVDTARTRDTSIAVVGQVAVAVAKRPRSTLTARRTATITEQPLPPLQLTPTRVDAELTRVTAPTSAVALPRVLRGGRGGGFVMARPTGASLVPTIRGDTGAGRATMSRIIRDTSIKVSPRDTVRTPR